MSNKSRNTTTEILDRILREIPPLRDEHNQAEIDAEAARILREAAEQRRNTDEIEKFLRS